MRTADSLRTKTPYSFNPHIVNLKILEPQLPHFRCDVTPANKISKQNRRDDKKFDINRARLHKYQPSRFHRRDFFGEGTSREQQTQKVGHT